MASLAHTDNHGRGVWASRCLVIDQNSFKFAGQMFLKCDTDTDIVKSGFIWGGVVITLDNYGDWNGAIYVKNQILDLLQRVCADHAFGRSKAKRFSMTFADG